MTWCPNSQKAKQSIIQSLTPLSLCCLWALMDSLNTGTASYWNSPFAYSTVNSSRENVPLSIPVVYFWKVYKCSIRTSTFSSLRGVGAYQQVHSQWTLFSVEHNGLMQVKKNKDFPLKVNRNLPDSAGTASKIAETFETLKAGHFQQHFGFFLRLETNKFWINCKLRFVILRQHSISS